jgi:manganese/zinc/iron transport system permease protein
MIWTSLDTWIVTAGILSAVACAIPGNFLVLRRMSLMGDAISHSVLPGLAIAFLVTGSRASFPMFVGAAVLGVLTAVLVEFMHKSARIEQGASLGSVFSVLFALGLILIVRGAHSVDLDPNCVLYGAIELTPLDTVALFGADIPRAVVGLAAVLVFDVALIAIFYKELNLSSFDPGLATSLGINAKIMHYLLMAMVAITTVAAFESVGSIIVIAMLIVPGAVGFLFAKRLIAMIGISIGVAVVSAIGGHLAAISVPPLFGISDTNTTGSMAVVAGLIFVAAMLVSPKDGLPARIARNAAAARRSERAHALTGGEQNVPARM